MKKNWESSTSSEKSVVARSKPLHISQFERSFENIIDKGPNIDLSSMNSLESEEDTASDPNADLQVQEYQQNPIVSSSLVMPKTTPAASEGENLSINDT